MSPRPGLQLSASSARRQTRDKPGSRRKKSVTVARAAVFATLLAAVLAWLLAMDVVALPRFLRWYSARFVAYYAPKVSALRKALRRIEPLVPDDVYDALDIAVALLCVVSLFHLIERLRTLALTKLR